MPIASLGNAATTPESSQPPEMESRGSAPRLLEEPPSGPDQKLYSKKDTWVRTRGAGHYDSKEVDKRSLDYVLRSGLAGGLAGCAVG